MNRKLGVIGGIGLGSGLVYLLNRNRRTHEIQDWVGRRRHDAGNWWRGRRRSSEAWTPTSRWLTGIAGGALTVYGLRARGALGKAASAVGAGLITSSATNRGVRSLAAAVPGLARAAR